MVGPLREALRIMHGRAFEGDFFTRNVWYLGPFEGSFLCVMHGGPFN